MLPRCVYKYVTRWYTTINENAKYLEKRILLFRDFDEIDKRDKSSIDL